MLPDHPALAHGLVALHAPAHGSGVLYCQILHPLHIAQIAHTLLNVDILSFDYNFLCKYAHYFLPGP